MILKACVAVLILCIAVTGIPIMVEASEPTDNQMTIILVDGSSIRQSENDIDSVRSLVAMIATTGTDRKVAFIDTERPSIVIGPTSVGSNNFADSITAIDSELISGNTEKSDIFGGLVQANTLVGLERPSAGSNVVLITGGSGSDNTESDYKRIAPLVDQLTEQSNEFHVITVGSISDATNEFASALVRRSGGEYFRIQNNSDINKTAINITSNITNTSLERLNNTTLTLNDIVSVSVDVLPETKNLQFFIYIENMDGSISLTNPNGVDSSLIDGSYIIEAPYVRSIRIEDPIPGTWSLDGNSVNGDFTVWSTSENELRLTLNNSGPIPVNEPSSLVVFASRGSSLMQIEDGKIYAYVTTPEGQTLAYTLNDSGIDSDTVAGDGYFSGSVGPFNSIGIHNVMLELSWNKMQYVLKSDSFIDVQHFPSIDIETLLMEDLPLNERTKVGTINVNVDGQPYPVAYDALAWDISSGESTQGILEIQANTGSIDSQDWIYDIFFTVDSAGQRTLSFALQLEYGGQNYIYTANPLFVSSLEVKPVTVVSDNSPALNQPQTESIQTNKEFPWWVIVFPISLGVALFSIFLNWTIKTNPTGYIFNDRDERVIDFSNLKRGVVSKVLFKNTISGKELGMTGFESVTFKFTKGKTCIESNRPSASIRIDNKPLSSKMQLSDKTWIGVKGKLYSFVQ